MNKFYFHYLAYIDGMSVQAKNIFLKEPLAAEVLFGLDDRRQIADFFKAHQIKEKEAESLERKFSDTALKQEAEKAYESLSEISFIDYFDTRYPERLKNIYNPPLGLYVKGRLPDENIPCVAVIGARQCSPYGVRWTGIFTRELCSQGVQIVSGMAKGIDGVAGRVASEFDGLNYAVLGSGINVCYPEVNRDLYEKLYSKGSLISEFPPDTPAAPYRFPLRNRIISGLADSVFVAEAAVRSGSHITAYFALEQGKDVFALPGPLDSHLSAGTNNLIKKGAFPALSSKDILENLKIFH